MNQIDVVKALKRAYQLGQTYRKQADSESTTQHFKADATQRLFDELVNETIAQAERADQVATYTCGVCGVSMSMETAKQKPLTEDQINQMWDESLVISDPTAGNHRFRFARSIEAHIKGEMK